MATLPKGLGERGRGVWGRGRRLCHFLCQWTAPVSHCACMCVCVACCTQLEMRLIGTWGQTSTRLMRRVSPPPGPPPPSAYSSFFTGVGETTRRDLVDPIWPSLHPILNQTPLGLCRKSISQFEANLCCGYSFPARLALLSPSLPARCSQVLR